jgi:hypothetical protein
VQPTDPFTGLEQHPAGQNGAGTPPTNGDVPFRAGAPEGVPGTIPSPKNVDEQTLEHWIEQLQQIIDTTAQNPRQRAEAIAELKVKYQEQVLGLQAPAKEE